MNIWLETMHVGLFSLSIYFCFQSIRSWNVLLLVVGMIKHYMGYWMGLQQLFCEQHTEFHHLNPPPMYEVIGEGIAFVLVGNLLSLGIPSRWIIVFLIGCGLHLISEVLGIHLSFLKRCSQ